MTQKVELPMRQVAQGLTGRRSQGFNSQGHCYQQTGGLEDKQTDTGVNMGADMDCMKEAKAAVEHYDRLPGYMLTMTMNEFDWAECKFDFDKVPSLMPENIQANPDLRVGVTKDKISLDIFGHQGQNLVTNKLALSPVKLVHSHS